jgi:hypothetical protein
LLWSLRSQNWQQGGIRAASCCLARVCVRAPGVGSACVDLAGRRTGSAAFLVRSCASLRGRSAPRRRSRRTRRYPGARSGRGNRLVRGNRADGREDRVDRDAARVHRHTRSPRLDRCEARSARRRRLGRGNRRPERRAGAHRAVRLLRSAHHERSAGVRRSDGLLAGAHTRPARDRGGRSGSRGGRSHRLHS